MTILNLTTASPETSELTYKSGILQALVDGDSIFGGASLRLAVSIDGSAFVLATIDDFNITSSDSLRFALNNSSKYKFMLDPVGVGADIDVYLIRDPASGGEGSA